MACILVGSLLALVTTFYTPTPALPLSILPAAVPEEQNIFISCTP